MSPPNRMRTRAKAHMPMVLLTLLSILQALASIFAIMTWVAQVIMRRAREDGDNDEFFSSTPPATLRDFLPHIVTIALLALLGVLLWASGHQGWLALVAISFSVGMLAWQTLVMDRFWRRSMTMAG